MNNTLKFLFMRTFQKGDNPERVRQKVCQDILILKLSNSDFLTDTIVFKGGIVMYELTKGKRGYTKDIDFDFIKYPISEEAIGKFIDETNMVSTFENINLQIQKTEELNHKNYHGRRVFLRFTDQENSSFELAVDIGVHLDKYGKPEVRPYDIKFSNKRVSIMIDSNNLSIVEKISTFALYGVDNLRYRDLFDAYWRVRYLDFNIDEIAKTFDEKLVFNGHFKSRKLAVKVITKTLRDKEYIKELKKEDNWTNETVEKICGTLIEFVTKLIDDKKK